MHALATGNWVGGRSGVSRLLDRTTYSRRSTFVRPVRSYEANPTSRLKTPTQWGRRPNETEGQNCGLVKNAAQRVDISEHVDERFIHAILDDMDVKKPLDWTDGDRILVNGDLYGVHKRGKNLVKEFKNARRRGNIPPEASIRHDIANREIFINTDKGRILRPLLILYPGKQDASLRLTPDHLERLESNQMTFRDLLKGHRGMG